jgi:transcriptional regulator with XRE-family HTH domain
MQNNSSPDREKIAARIKDARTMAGLSQAKAAEMLNLQRPAISEIEAAKRKVNVEEAIQMAELYKVDLSWLLCQEQNDDANLPEQVKFAARDLNKLKPDEMNKVIDIIKMLPKKKKQ